MNEDVYQRQKLIESREFFSLIVTIKKEWKKFVSKGDTSSITSLRPEIISSWRRSYEMGVNPHQLPREAPGYLLNPEELASRIAANIKLIDIATPILDTLVSNIGCPDYRVEFFDKDLYLLKQFGKAEPWDIKKHTRVGMNRSENFSGTNAVALASILQTPIQLVGPEHYHSLVHSVACSAVPLFLKDLGFQGVINISGPIEQIHSHTLGMAIALGKAIELSYAQQKLLEDKDLAFQYIEHIVDSISDGIIAFDANGKFTVINRNASKILDINPKLALGKDARQFFNPTSTIINTLNTGVSILDRELTFTSNGDRKIVIGNCIPLTKEKPPKGVLSVFTEVNRAKARINNLAGFKAYYTFDDLQGRNPKFVNLINLAKSAAELPSNVLILGESGTGKELFAQSLHNASRVHRGPFVAINCGAIPTSLIESELFGYEGGAFTGGKREGHHGKFALAEGGTLFLDEIDSLSLANQATLLRVLQSKSYTRVGGNTELKFDARIIVASNQNLWKEVNNGNFRQDLFYRINVITLEIPPLRDRKDDIHELALYFSKQCAKRLKFNFTFSDDGLSAMINYSWPGNIRELENIIERCAVMAYSQGINYIDANLIAQCGIKSDQNTIKTGTSTEEILCLKTLEKQTIMKALAQSNNNIMQAAKELGIARKTLYNKINTYQLDNLNHD